MRRAKTSFKCRCIHEQKEREKFRRNRDPTSASLIRVNKYINTPIYSCIVPVNLVFDKQCAKLRRIKYPIVYLATASSSSSNNKNITSRYPIIDLMEEWTTEWKWGKNTSQNIWNISACCSDECIRVCVCVWNFHFSFRLLIVSLIRCGYFMLIVFCFFLLLVVVLLPLLRLAAAIVAIIGVIFVLLLSTLHTFCIDRPEKHITNIYMRMVRGTTGCRRCWRSHSWCWFHSSISW